MAITDIDWGTVTLTNGSTSVTGSGTSWIADDIRDGDTFVFVDGGDGFQQPIVASVQSNTALTLREPWLGPTLSAVTYTLRYQWDSSRVSAMSRRLIMLLDNGNLTAFSQLTGPGIAVFDGPHSMVIRPITDFVNGVRFDVQVDTLADRAAYDGQTQGFTVLVSDMGDGRSAVFTKNSNTSADWSDAAYITGPVGPIPDIEATVSMLPPGSTATVVPTPIVGGVRLDFNLPQASGFNNEGVYSAAVAYVRDDVVRHNGSSFIALQAVPAGTSPSNAFPPVDTSFWQVLAVKGADGTGTGDVVGPSGAVADRIAVFDGTTGKLIKDGGVTIAELQPEGAVRYDEAQSLTQGEQSQARLNIGALPEGISFQTTVTASSGMGAAWTLTTTPVGTAKDALLINHILDAPSNGVHVLATALTGVSGGQAGGFAMNGPGTASALVGNRYEDGDGHAVNGARIGTGDGWAGLFSFSSEGVGGGVYAIKQPSGSSGLSGTGPALSAENTSVSGEAILSSTSLSNDGGVSNKFIRLNTKQGIVNDILVVGSIVTRTGKFTGERIALSPSGAWSGSSAVSGIEVLANSNVTGSDQVTLGEFTSDAAGNITNIGVLGTARGANGVNYGGWFRASEGTNNIAVRTDGASQFNGNLEVNGTLSKSAGTFLIDHPLDPENRRLAHGFVEAPRYDLIYRGEANLANGRATIDIDAASNMTGGTFAALTTNAVVTSLQNQDGFARLRPGKIEGGEFEIICEDEACTDTVSWVVIAERNDAFVKSDLDPNTDSEGRFVPEREREE